MNKIYKLFTVRKYELAGLLGGFDACASETSHTFSQFRTVMWLADVDEKVAEQCQLHVDLRYQLRTRILHLKME